MSNTEFPYKAFRLMPSLLIREVTITGKSCYSNWLSMNNSGLADVSIDELFWTHAKAVKAAQDKLEQQRAKHKVAGDNIEKRAKNLEKMMRAGAAK